MQKIGHGLTWIMQYQGNFQHIRRIEIIHTVLQKSRQGKTCGTDGGDDIARKTEADADAKARLQAVNSLSLAIDTEAKARTEGDNAISSQLSSHAGNKSNPHGVTAVR